MPVVTFTQPNFTAQLGSAYKGNIDAAIAALAQLAINFLPHEASTPNMTVVVEPGRLWAGATVEKAQQSTATISAPATNPRIDRIIIDALTGNVAVVTGAESASPVAPAVPTGKLPIARISLTVGMTQIINTLITDERAIYSGVMSSLLVGSPVGGAPVDGAINMAKGAYINGRPWRTLVHEQTISAATSSVTITGLDGDLHERYLIELELKTQLATETLMSLRINGDTATNYNWAGISHRSDLATTNQYTDGTNQAVIKFGPIGSSTGSVDGVTYAQVELQAKSGSNRLLSVRSSAYSGITPALWQTIFSGIWKNTANNITSLQFFEFGGNNNIGSGSVIRVWAGY